MPTLTGSLHPSNKNAIAWNGKGLVLYACHSVLVCVDARTQEVFQTLEHHNSAINLVCWQSEPDLLKNEHYTLKCASSDISGNIAVWDVIQGTICSKFRYQNHVQTIDMKWPQWNELNNNFVLTLHSNSAMVLWNGSDGEKVWEYRLQTVASSLAISPFSPTDLALSSVGFSIILIDDLSLHRAPCGKKSLINMSVTHQNSKESAILRLQYHAANEHQLFVLFATEVFCIETQSKQVIYSAVIDTGSPLAQILPCRSRDCFFLVHQNGAISFRMAMLKSTNEGLHAKLVYDRICTAEPHQRHTVRIRAMGAALCPVSECTICVMLNSGRLLFYELNSRHSDIRPYRVNGLENLLIVDENMGVCAPNLRFVQSGFLSPLSSSLTTVRMRPTATATGLPLQPVAEDTASPAPVVVVADIDQIAHLAAIGTGSGAIHLVNAFTGRIERDLQIHTCPVRCLEWSGLNTIISAAYTASLSSSSTVKNDIFMTDVRTGVKKRVRPETDESPIELIRVSFYQCYLAIAFRNDPLEIWELNSMRLLRRMSKRCPTICDMAWSGKHHSIKSLSEKTQQIYRENLVVLDNDNHLYHVVVKGLHVKDGKEVNTQWKSGATLLRCLVWKDDMLAFGDSAGRIGVWDLARSQCRQSGMGHSTHGPVLRCVFSRLSGDYSLAVQHQTSIAIWDTERFAPVQYFQRPGLSVIDMDMCGLTPVYIASDGAFRLAISTEKENRNGPISDSDAPLLLRREYYDSLKKYVLNLRDESEEDRDNATNASEPSEHNHSEQQKSALLAMDSDIGEFIESLDDTKLALERWTLFFKFVGRLCLAQFCRVIAIFTTYHRCNETTEQKGENTPNQSNLLSSNLKLFWPSTNYQKHFEQMVRILLSTCKNSEQMDQAIEKCVVLQKRDVAINALLSNEHTKEPSDTRLNLLKVSLLAAEFRSEEAKSLVKLAATDLISRNFVSDGIQLLYLIDQGINASKYLVSHGQRMKSVEYSKLCPNSDPTENIVKYVEHLTATDKSPYTAFALMLLASIGKWEHCEKIMAKHSAAIDSELLSNINHLLSIGSTMTARL